MFALILFGLFSDHMVLQRGRTNPVWGTDHPAQKISLSVEGAARPISPVEVVADPEGKWSLQCPELPTGGPYKLLLHGSTDKVIDDVWVGDVWIASGQSNMEFPLARARDADKEIASANYPQIRVAKVTRAMAGDPATEVKTGWDVCSPTNASRFTAVGYFFAREVFQKTQVPIGIIDSTWGGTPVEAWTSRQGLRPVFAGIDQQLDAGKLSEPELQKIRREYQAKLHAWEVKAFPQDTGNEGQTKGWANLDWNDDSWRRIDNPTTVQAQGLKANGVFWFRRTVEVPAAWAGHDLELDLGAIDDFDISYFNGEQVGETGSDTPDAYQALRQYKVPGRLVHAGKNVIAVRVFDRFGDGGMTGPASAMSLGSDALSQQRLPLAGNWRWTVEREIPLVPSTVFAGQPPLPSQLTGPSSPTVLYNGMIAPLIPYGISGYIWYQGEANVSNYSTYRDRMVALIRDWRTRWGEGNLPFYLVQLAGYHESVYWPYLREAQSQACAEPNTGMALAIDVGNPSDIHPTDKQDVGDRLARLARVRVYGDKSVEDSGPSVDKVAIEGDRVTIRWQHGKGLHTHDGNKAVLGFALAGSDGSYHSASARIEHDEVVVQSADVPQPRSVRYAWADYTDVNLENGAGLPAEPFRTDDFDPQK